MHLRLSVLAVVALSAAACSADKKPETTLPAGEHMLAVPGGSIWYKQSGTGIGTPVILLHGGPGYNSYYMKAFELVGDDKVALLGHSWGTILAHEYYQAHPEHVASIIFASPALDIPTWERNAKRLVKTLSAPAQAAIAKAEASGKYDDSSFVKANDEFFGKFVMLRPDKANLDSTFAGLNEAIYLHMQGPSEYTITGTLKRYNSTAALSRITVPVLFMVGSNDEADPATVKQHADMTPGARYVVIDSAAHLFTWDNPVQGVKAVRAFLRSADSASQAKH